MTDVPPARIAPVTTDGALYQEVLTTLAQAADRIRLLRQDGTNVTALAGDFCRITPST